jgi:hypothetical protein
VATRFCDARRGSWDHENLELILLPAVICDMVVKPGL